MTGTNFVFLQEVSLHNHSSSQAIDSMHLYKFAEFGHGYHKLFDFGIDSVSFSICSGWKLSSLSKLKTLKAGLDKLVKSIIAGGLLMTG